MLSNYTYEFVREGYDMQMEQSVTYTGDLSLCPEVNGIECEIAFTRFFGGTSR